MKFSILATSAAILFASGLSLADDAFTSSNRGILRDLSNVAEKCVVHPFVIDSNGSKNMLPLASVCEELIIHSQTQATLIFQGLNFYAETVESENADGGDLNHLIIRNQHGNIIATRRNVAAYGDVLIALTGGQDHFPEVQK